MKCPRCGEEMSIFERKYINDEIICENCYQGAKESGEIAGQEKVSYLSVKILRIIDIIYLIYSIVSVADAVKFTGINSKPQSAFGPIVGVLLIFFAVWVFTVLFDIVLKIYLKLK